MKILLIAESGYTENALAVRFRERERAYLSVSVAQLMAIEDLGQYLRQQRISVMVNTASASLLKLEGFDFDEHLFQLTRLFKAGERLKLPFIHMSNSRVFDSEEGRSYRESDLAEPSTEIGEKYQRLEALLRERCKRHIILRISTLLSAQGDNALTSLLRRLQAGGEVGLSLHGNNAPVHVNDFSRLVVALVDQLSCGVDEWSVNVWGDYHYVSSDPTTSYHFGETVLAAMSQYTNCEQVVLMGIDNIDAEWRRPLLNCEKLLNTFGLKQMPWRSSIVASVKVYFESEGQSEHKENINE